MVASADETTRLVHAIRENAHPLHGADPDLTPLLDLIGDARFVLLGEASHGTHEFYHARALITQRLIQEKGFRAVVVEADWPDAYRVNRYVRGMSQDADAADALGSFLRFPTWMWRNSDVLDFIGWLREHNDAIPDYDGKAGFYGMDLYSLYGSIRAVLEYLEKVDPDAAKRARYRYACFEHFGEDPQSYGYAAGFDLGRSCEDEVVQQLQDLRRQAFEYMHRDGRLAEDEYFFVEQNARLVRNAEEYYRSMFGSRVSSWNLRDQHMAETLDALVNHMDQRTGGTRSKVVVWAHNSHLGDARATEMGRGGELNVGQLIRQRYGSDAVLIGFTTHTGTVTAASDWDAPAERKSVRPSLSGSYESIFHQTGVGDFLLALRDQNPASIALRDPRLERAIGVIYLPRTERASHYFHAVLPAQFDAIIHYDHSRAVEPLERTAGWHRGEVPETFPTGV